MIEPTDEMRQAFADAAGWPPAPWMFGPDVERGITAVLALAERQWQEQYGDAFQAGWWRGQHELCPRCGDALEREANPPGQKSEQVRQLRSLLSELVDPDNCWTDHNGLCQAHSLDPAPCPHARAKAVLAIPPL